ncbi:NADH:ubiquinone reductase (H(+)-translocating) [Trifolium repens]|nr:NADH:ubiquinone reductase (H(+)-translocating) [Trifolium repens]
MAARSSNEIIQEPFNPTLPPIIDLNSKDNLVYQHNQTDAGPDSYEFYTEKFVDFESLKANGIDVQNLFFDQKWENYFEMLNGFVYYNIVKYFWQKAKVFYRASADEEYKNLIAKNKSLKGKTRQELGLKPYRGREIRSNILGINVVITQAHIAKILGLDNQGEDIEVYDTKSKYLNSINQDLFKPGSSNRDFGKLKCMRHKFEFAFRVFLATIVTREGGLDTISIPHKHFIWFLYKKVKVNLAKILFDHMCLTITASRTKVPSNIHHPRLISELIRQTKLTDILSAKEKLRVFQTAKYDATVLVNMKRKTKNEIISVKSPLQQVYEQYFWCDGFPTISEHDNEDVIKNFIEIVRRETGVRVPRKMVVSVPNWEIFKGPKAITRSQRKPKTTEQEIADDGSEDQENADADEAMGGDSGAEDMATEAIQKERRSKKRNDRPQASDEDQNPAMLAKRLKSRASKPKGKVSEPNTSSIPIAQDINPEPQPSISPPPQTTNQTNPIDFTVPLSVVLPDHGTILSSSSDTSTDSDESIAKIIRKAPKKTNLKRTTKRPIKKPIQLSSDEETPIIIDTTILHQPANTESVLDHLQQHLSGDAFTHSNPNTPPCFPFTNTTADQVDQEPPVTQFIQTPPPSLDHISQVNPPTFTPVQDEPIAHSEAQQESSHQSPNNVMTEQQPPSPPPECYTSESSSAPSPQPVFDPLNKPLVLEEVLELYQHISKAEAQIFKDTINVDDDIIPPNLSKIKIINLKRKQPEPTIPFDPSIPFFNSDSEPNLELLHNAIGIRLKRFKQREEEALIFPSDLDADVREIEYLFSQSLQILSTHLKNKTKDRGMNTARELFEIAERSCAPRLTFYNHEEECARLAALDAEIKKLARSACETAEKLISEEGVYELTTKQAWIAAEQARADEAEYKRLAEQEALKVMISMGTHIATVETNKILADQVIAENIQMLELLQHEQEDADMVDKSPMAEVSGKGKEPIVDQTPPASPKIEKGSASSEIPPAVQQALDSIRTELAEDIKNEIDELRIDLRTDLRANLRADITASENNTRQRMDAMMETLLKDIAEIKKP